MNFFSDIVFGSIIVNFYVSSRVPASCLNKIDVLIRGWTEIYDKELNVECWVGFEDCGEIIIKLLVCCWVGEED